MLFSLITICFNFSINAFNFAISLDNNLIQGAITELNPFIILFNISNTFKTAPGTAGNNVSNKPNILKAVLAIFKAVLIVLSIASIACNFLIASLIALIVLFFKLVATITEASSTT